MKKFAILIASIIALLSMGAVQAGQFGGGYFGAKLGANNSSATDTNGTEAASERTVAYFINGGYLQGGYNLDLSAVVIGVGAYGDWNGKATHGNGVLYGSHSYGFDAKLGLPLGNWLPYAKLGRGQNKGTDDLRVVSQSGPNTAVGFEYKLASHWSTIGEYKINKFSSPDGSITINNKTFTFGLNYHFDEPPIPEPPPEPEPAPEPELAAAPEPELAPVPAPAVPEVWKIFLEEKAVRIEGSNFVAGSAKLELVSGKQQLKEVADYASSHLNTNLEVVGYTDNSGSEQENKKLSLARAQSVKKYLVNNNGVKADRISVKGEGSASPIADNDSIEGRALNNRVEIRSIARIEKKKK